ncbi:MAG: tetratricopeptide repeat protein [Planctomycetota bacterium]
MRIGWTALRSLGLTAGTAFLLAGCGLVGEKDGEPAAPITRATVEELFQDAYYDQAQQSAETLLAQAREQSGEESLAAADAMQLIAEARRRGSGTHDPETLELAEGALRIKERRLGGDHVDVAECLHQLGMLHQRRGEMEQAREFLRRAWAIREARLGPADPAVARSLMAYGGLLLTDTSDEALDLLERARVIQDATLDPSHPDVALRMMFEAYIHHTRGELDPALRLYQDALTILEQTLRPEHPTLATVHRSLGQLAHDSCDYAGARPHHERALTILESNYGKESCRAAEMLRLLAAVDAALGNNDVARERYLRALRILRKEYGDQHLSVAWCSLGLGYLMREERDLGAAQENYERALRFVDGGQAPEDFVIEARIHYGSFLQVSGDLAGAEEQYEQVRAMLSQEGGRPNLDLSRALYNLGFMAYQRGEFDRALDLIRQAIEGLGSSPEARTAPQYAHALIGLAMAEFATGNREEALEHALLAERVSRDHMRANSAGLERMLAITFASVRTTGLDLALSIILEDEAPTAASRRAVAREIIRSRGLIFEEMALRHRAMTTASSPPLTSRATALREAITELSNLLVRGPGRHLPSCEQGHPLIAIDEWTSRPASIRCA